MTDEVVLDAQTIIVDKVVLVCSGCGTERMFDVPERLRGAQEVIEWLKTEPTRCGCGATTCSAKLHVVNPS